MRAAPESDRGWHSLFYQNLEPAPSLRLQVSGKTVNFWTCLGPTLPQVSTKETGKLLVENGDWKAEIHFNEQPSLALVKKIVVVGAFNDQLF